MPATEIIEVLAGGTLYSAWESTSIRASVKEAARSFELSLAAEIGPDAVASIFQAFMPVQILASGDLVVSGYVDLYKPSLGPEHAKIDITGRSKGADAVDCSVDHTKPDYVGKSLLDIANDQDVFGIGFAADVSLQAIDRWRPNPGETLHESLELLARHQRVTMAGQPDGSIKITRAGETAQRHAGALVEGWNIHEGHAEHDGSNRHSEVNAHGQSYKGNGSENTQITAKATDGSVPRKRPLHLLHHGHADRQRIKDRARHRRDKEAGEGLRANITTVGWRDDGGTLWTPGWKIFVSSPFLQLSQDMLVEDVTYTQTNEGTLAHLELVDPRAHGGSGGGVDNSGGGWGGDYGDAE